MLLGFASLFVVIPYLSSDKTLYGIYSACTALTIFFSYADLGFLPSGVKYASEYYIKGDLQTEIKIVGFTVFIMLPIFFALTLGIAIIGIIPKLLIPELIEGSDSFYIARKLLLVLAVSSPIIMAQRILNIVFTIRVENYKYHKMMILGSFIRILSILYFFRENKYQIVEFYTFFQFVNLAIVLYGISYIRKYNYHIKKFLHEIRFDRAIFDKVKKLSITSFLIFLSVVIFYELDQIAISHILGIEAVAIYGAALSIFMLVRTFCSLVYSPYSSRYNHFIGLGDYFGLTRFVNKMILVFAPIIIIPITTLSLLAEPFVVSWLGIKYAESSIIASLLVLSFIINFITDPISNYFISMERNTYLVKYNLLLPLVYWTGVISFIGLLGLKSFAIFKFIVPYFLGVGYYFLAKKDFKARGYKFVYTKELFMAIISPFVIVCTASVIAKSYMISEHSTYALFLNIIIMCGVSFISFLLSVPFNSTLRYEIACYFGRLKKMR